MLENKKVPDGKAKLVLAGAGEYGQYWLEWIWQEGRDILCFADRDENKVGKKLCGKRIICYGELNEIQEKFNIFITVMDARVRKEIETVLSELGFDGQIVEHPIYVDCKISRKSYMYHSCLEGKNLICDDTELVDSLLGKCSYMGKGTKIVKTKVGKYTCIGPGVKIIRGQHPTSAIVSIHPAFYATNHPIGYSYVKEDKFKELREVEPGFAVVVGNDVWIGADVKIMEGVTIADGSIVAAGAVVVKDTEPFEIVGGVPARHIKYRFEEEERDMLLKIQWWNRDSGWIQEHADDFVDIKRFLNVVFAE